MLKASLQPVYNRLRPALPEKIGVFNGVAVRHPRLLDVTDERMDWKEPNITALQDTVSPGDDVIVIGGGLGVTAVHAARQSRTGDIIVYEAATERAQIVTDTLRLNGETATVVEAVVGDSVHVEGSQTDQVEHPADLPECDVLEMDCEGAELSILKDLAVRPRAIIVETHGFRGTPTRDVRERLRELDYKLMKKEPVDVEKDAYVLTAVAEECFREVSG